MLLSLYLVCILCMRNLLLVDLGPKLFFYQIVIMIYSFPLFLVSNRFKDALIDNIDMCWIIALTEYFVVDVVVLHKCKRVMNVFNFHLRLPLQKRQVGEKFKLFILSPCL